MIHIHFYMLPWCIGALLILIYFKTFLKFLKEMLSEKTLDNTVGKASSKRVGVMLFALSFIYVFIYSMHTGKIIDHYMATLVCITVVLGWQITSPEALGNLIDKVKGFTNINKITEEDKK